MRIAGAIAPPNGISHGSRRPFHGMAGLVLRLTIAVAALAWVFHDIHPGRLAGDLARIQWGWVAAAVACDVLSYMCQGLRWKVLLGPVGGLSWLRSTQAIYAGLFTNEILPMRFGELVRAYIVSRLMGVGFADVIPSVAVERLLDGIWLAFAIGLVSMSVPLPGYLVDAADIFGIAVCVLTILFLILIFRGQSLLLRHAERTAARRHIGSLFRILVRLLSGIRGTKELRIIIPAFFLSLALLVLQAAAFRLVMVAYGIHIPLLAGVAVFLIMYFGTAIPNAPSNIGSYQFFTVLGLMLFGTDKTTAAGFSLTVFVILTVPLWVIGFYAINSSGLSLRSMKTEIGRVFARDHGASEETRSHKSDANGSISGGVRNNNS